MLKHLNRHFKFVSLLMALMAPSIGHTETLDSANTAWLITATALVLFMTIPGLSLFYGGLVRVKNVLSVLMQCFAITCISSIIWLVCGYSLAFGDGGEFNKVCDVNLIVPESDTPRIQEMHIFLGHTICHLIELAFTAKD